MENQFQSEKTNWTKTKKITILSRNGGQLEHKFNPQTTQ